MMPCTSCFGKALKSWFLCKCGFHKSKVEFLGYIISRNGVRMDLHKVQTIVEWATLVSIWDVQCFLGFPDFY
jgi:hypothetical protein